MKAREGQVRLRLTPTRGQHREPPRPSLLDDRGLERALAHAGLAHQTDRAAPYVNAVQPIAETVKLLVATQQRFPARHRSSMTGKSRTGYRRPPSRPCRTAPCRLSLSRPVRGGNAGPPVCG